MLNCLWYGWTGLDVVQGVKDSVCLRGTDRNNHQETTYKTRPHFAVLKSELSVRKSIMLIYTQYI